ncbi:MAG: hypothetical protein ACQERB_14770 [Promethearchaeati archaeon]
MISELINIQFVTAIVSFISILFYLLLINSAKKQGKHIENPEFLILFALIGIALSLNRILSSFIPVYNSFVGSVVVNIIINILVIVGCISLLLYAYENKKYFETHFLTGAKLILISHIFAIATQYINILLSILGFSVTMISTIFTINSIISEIIFIVAFGFLILHGINKEDNSIVTGAFIQICLLLLLLTIAIASLFL